MLFAQYSKTVTGASLLIIAVSLISKVMGLFREMAFASTFGIHRSFDALLVASAIPITAASAILYISQNFLVPQFHTASDTRTLPEKLSGFLALFFLWSVLISIALYFSASVILSQYITGAGSEERYVIAQIFKLYVLGLPFIAISSVLTSYLYAEFKFFTASLLLVLPNAAMILGVLLFQRTIGIYSIPLGNLTGYLLQTAILLFIVRPSIPRRLNLGGLLSAGQGKVLLAIIIIEVIGQVYILADRYFFALVPEGSIAAINYATTLFILPLQIIPLALSTVIFTKISKDYQAGDIENVRANLLDSTLVLIYLFIPITAGYLFFGEGVVRLLYERGKFDARAVDTTFGILRILASGLSVYAVYSIFNRVLYSLRMVNVILLITVTAIFAKVLGNALLVSAYGSNGLAVSTVLAYVVSLSLSIVFLMKRDLLHSARIYFDEVIAGAVNGIVSYYIVSNLVFIRDEMLHLCVELLLFVIVFIVNSVIVRQKGFLLVAARIPFLEKYSMGTYGAG